MTNFQAAGSSGKDGNDDSYSKRTEYKMEQLGKAEKKLKEEFSKIYKHPPSAVDIGKMIRAFGHNGIEFENKYVAAQKRLPKVYRDKDSFSTVVRHALGQTKMEVALGFYEEEKAKSNTK